MAQTSEVPQEQPWRSMAGKFYFGDMCRLPLSLGTSLWPSANIDIALLTFYCRAVSPSNMETVEIVSRSRKISLNVILQLQGPILMSSRTTFGFRFKSHEEFTFRVTLWCKCKPNCRLSRSLGWPLFSLHSQLYGMAHFMRRY